MSDSDDDKDLKDYWWAILIGAIVLLILIILLIYLLVKCLNARKLRRLREIWNSREDDVVTLHMFDRAMTGPNSSPYPSKLEIYFRMCKIK